MFLKQKHLKVTELFHRKIVPETILSSKRTETLKKLWYTYSKNKSAVFGLILLMLIILSTIFAPFITPYPSHVGAVVDFENAGKPPSFKHFFGTDLAGRDIFTRVIFGYRFSLLMGVVVLSISLPIGITLGLVAGYYKDSWVDTLFMRITDTILAIPPLLMALAISAVLPTSLFYAMIAVTFAYWPYHARLIYGMSKQISSESFILAAESIGARKFHIIFKEILPNCIGAVFTKITIDMGLVILMGAVLSFVGLGVQPPKPGLGTMIADGSKFLPGVWWITLFPALAIVLVVYAFNLVGDGLAEAMAAQEM